MASQGLSVAPPCGESASHPDHGLTRKLGSQALHACFTNGHGLPYPDQQLPHGADVISQMSDACD